MATTSLRITLSVVVFLMGLSACAQGPNRSIVPSRWSFRALTTIKGAVVCVECSLEEARTAYPDTRDLYELESLHGQLVMRVDWVSDAVRWTHVTLGNRLWIRADVQVFQQLTAHAHRFQEVEISGLLRDERTLDIARITVIG